MRRGSEMATELSKELSMQFAVETIQFLRNET